MWHSFPAAQSLLVPGLLWVQWRATEYLSQYLTDRFAIGGPDEMRPYFTAHHLLVNETLWPLLRDFENTWDGLDPEEVWTASLVRAGVLARQHRGICFNVLEKTVGQEGPEEAEDNCQTRPRQLHKHGYSLDSSWVRRTQGFLAGQFSHDHFLTARLLHFWFSEWARVGRPAKILDMGCGRATMMERWLKFYPPGIACVEMMPKLKDLLGDDLLEYDLTEPLPLERFARTRECATIPLRPPPIAKRNKARYADVVLCCMDPECQGLRDYVSSGAGAAEDFMVLPRHVSRPNTLPWARGRADWTVLLDVAAEIPRQRLRRLFRNVARVSAVGVIFRWGADGAGNISLADFGFVRDLDTEAWLRPFYVVHSEEIQLFRRRSLQFKVPQLCDLALVEDLSTPEPRCSLATYGCVDDQHIWVNDGCNGWFSRGGFEVGCFSFAGESAARSRWTYSPKRSPGSTARASWTTSRSSRDSDGEPQS